MARKPSWAGMIPADGVEAMVCLIDVVKPIVVVANDGDDDDDNRLVQLSEVRLKKT